MAESYVVFESSYGREKGKTTKTIANTIKALEDNFAQSCANAMRKATLAVESDAKAYCPVDTGNLRQSIQSTVEIEESGNVVGYVGSNLEYAVYVHQGTGIYAREGNGRKEVPWGFKGKNGKMVLTYGIRSTPFIELAIQNNQDTILRYFKAVLTND